MDSSTSILIYGHDHGLLETRRLVLQQAGFQAWTVTNLADAEKVMITASSGLLILCQSLSEKECEKALAMSHSRQPGMKNLVLMGTAPVCNLGQNDELMNSFDGPKALIATVNRLLRRNSSTRQRTDVGSRVEIENLGK
jgi:DNA-binding response OmpR family regulator